MLSDESTANLNLESNEVSLSNNDPINSEEAVKRTITVPEALGLDFHSFTPEKDSLLQVHFISNVVPSSDAEQAGLKNGDRLLQINGIDITRLEHEDVRKLLQILRPLALTVENNQKFLNLLKSITQTDIVVEQQVSTESQSPVEENPPTGTKDRLERRISKTTSVNGKSTNESTNAKTCDNLLLHTDDLGSLKVKRCFLRRSRNYDGYGLLLQYHRNLHLIGNVEESSPAYHAGIRENDIILFVSKKNVEKLTHDDVKTLIRALSLASHEVELTVINKSDMARYKDLQQKNLINWGNLNYIL